MKNPDQRKVITPGPKAGVRIFGVRASCGAHARSQRGVVLILTLIVLVAMTLAAIALVRSVDTGNVVAGNLAFKQGETHAGDAGTEAAIAFLRAIQANGNAFAVDDTYSGADGALGTGYHASIIPSLDITGNSIDPQRPLVDWGYNNCSIAANSGCYEPSTKQVVGAGYSVSYIIQRMCSSVGPVLSGANDCVSFTSQSGQSPNRGSIDYAHNRRFALTPVAYFRITSRVTGPRNTVSYIDTIVHF